MQSVILPLLLTFTAFLASGSASALVTINHSTTACCTALNVGDTIQIQVRVSWDGQGDLSGIFLSTGIVAGPPGFLSADSAVSGANLYRSSLFPFTDPATGSITSLGRIGQNILRAPGDPLDAVRSVQYLSLGAINAGGAVSNVLVTTITYRTLGVGIAAIGTVLLSGDTGVVGDQAGQGTVVVVSVVPEPSTALMILLGLAGLDWRQRVHRERAR